MTAEGPNSDLCFRASPVGIPDYDPPHRKMVSEVQVAFIRVPERPQLGCCFIVVKDKRLTSSVGFFCLTIACSLHRSCTETLDQCRFG